MSGSHDHLRSRQAITHKGELKIPEGTMLCREAENPRLGTKTHQFTPKGILILQKTMCRKCKAEDSATSPKSDTGHADPSGTGAITACTKAVQQEVLPKIWKFVHVPGEKVGKGRGLLQEMLAQSGCVKKLGGETHEVQGCQAFAKLGQKGRPQQGGGQLAGWIGSRHF